MEEQNCSDRVQVVLFDFLLDGSDFMNKLLRNKLGKSRFWRSNQKDVKTFLDFKLGAPNIVEQLKDMGYSKPSPLQSENIPPMIQGLDVVCESCRGTDRMITYSIGILEKVQTTSSIGNNCGAIAIILIKGSGKEYDFNLYAIEDVLSTLGGEKLRIRNNFHNVEECEVAVGRMDSPSLREDLLNIHCDVSMVIVDVNEFASLSQKDFDLLQYFSKATQICIFGRNITNASKIEGFFNQLTMTIPRTRIKSSGFLMSDKIRHFFIDVELEIFKLDTLLDLLLISLQNKHVITFFNSGKRASHIEYNLGQNNQSAKYYSPQLFNAESILEGYRANEYPLLVHDDEDIGNNITGSLFINYDLPYRIDSYFSRIQTESNEKCKMVINLVRQVDVYRMKEIESFFSIRIDECPYDFRNFL